MGSISEAPSAIVQLPRRTGIQVTYPSLMKDGSQPLNIQLTPSLRKMVESKCTKPCESCELMTRVLMTSTGEQMVVAMTPLRRLALKCITNPSWNRPVASNTDLAWSYVAS